MQLRKTLLSAVLLAVGFILHQIIPSFGGVTFDVQLAMLFVIIAINLDIKNTLAVSLASGIITALTTKFPGGQIPNMLDKLVTGLLIYFMLTVLNKLVNKQMAITITGFVGTIISGTTFLTSALVMVGLPMSFTALFLAVVLPTALANMVITPLLYNIVGISKKATGFSIDF